MLKILYASYLGPSQTILAQFTFETRVTAQHKISNKSLERLFWGFKVLPGR